jgi:hypothetical protein
MISGIKRGIVFFIVLIAIISLSLIGCSNNQKDTSTASSSLITTSTTEPSLTSTTTTSTSETLSTSTTTTLAPTTPPSTSTTTSATEPQADAKKIADSAISAWAKVVSYQYDMNTLIKMSGIVENMTQNVNISLTGTGVSNVTVNEMQMTGNMDIETPGQGKISMPIVSYSINGWEYAKVSVPITGEKWVKVKNDINSFESKDDAQKMLELLQTASDITFEGREDIAGTSCYVLSVNPDQTLMIKLFESLMENSSSGAALSKLDLNKSLKYLTIREWIAKDTSILKKSDLKATLILSGTDLGTSQPGDNLNMDITTTITMDQYNQTFTITLPLESQSAMDVTPQK